MEAGCYSSGLLVKQYSLQPVKFWFVQEGVSYNPVRLLPSGVKEPLGWLFGSRQMPLSRQVAAEAQHWGSEPHWMSAAEVPLGQKHHSLLAWRARKSRWRLSAYIAYICAVLYYGRQGHDEMEGAD